MTRASKRPLTATGTVDLSMLLSTLEAQSVMDPPAAIATALDVMAVVDDAGSLGERIRFRRLLSMAYSHTSQFEAALFTCEEAEALPDVASEPVELARLRLAAMQPLANLDRTSDAIARGHDALRMLRRHGESGLAGRAALNLGAILAMTGRPAEALPLFDQAKLLISGDPVLLGQIESNRGTALAALDRFEEAEQALGRAARLLSTDEMSWAAAIAEESLADLAARQGDINASLRHFEAARRHFEQDGAFADLGRLNAEEAAVLAESGLTLAARQAFEAAISLLSEHGTPADQASAELAFGQALIDAGDFDAASLILKNLLHGEAPDEHSQLVQQRLTLRARLALVYGDLDDAAKAVAAGSALTASWPVQRLRWSILAADLAIAEQRTDNARDLLDEAITIAERVQVLPVIGDLHERSAAIARAAGDEQLANDHARRAVDAFERIRGTIRADRLRQSFHHRRLGVSADLYLSLLGDTTATAQIEAFAVAEKMRGRMLLDAMHIRLSSTDVHEGTVVGDKPLARRLAVHRRWLNWMYSAIADGLEPNNAQLDELKEHEEAAARLADRLAVSQRRPGLDEPASHDAVREHLAPGDVALSFLNANDQLTVQIVTADIVEGRVLAPSAEIGALVAEAQFQIGRALAQDPANTSTARKQRLLRDANAVLGDLYDRLLGPIDGALAGAQRVIVAPSGELHSIPFAALFDGQRYLIDRAPVMTVPGFSVLTMLPKHIADTGPALVAGVPDAIAPGLGNEAEFVAGRVAGSRLLLGNQATRDAVLARMQRARLTHLACHGRFDSVHPDASGLLLADGWLTLDMLLNIRLDHPLVMLTGCETGRVRVDDGDDLTGIVAAMISAGAGALVASLWKTHDRAMQSLMWEFYAAMERQGNISRALQQAQQAVRAELPHPAYWAPLVAVHG